MIVDKFYKRPSAVDARSINFTNRMYAGETVASHIVTALHVADVIAGIPTPITQVDSSVAVLNSPATRVGNIITQDFKNGTHGQIHLIKYAYTTNLGRTDSDELLMEIYDPAAAIINA